MSKPIDYGVITMFLSLVVLCYWSWTDDSGYKDDEEKEINSPDV